MEPGPNASSSSYLGAVTPGLAPPAASKFEEYDGWTFYASYFFSYSSFIFIIFGLGSNTVNLVVFRGQGIQDGVILSLFTLSLSDLVMCVMLFGAAVAGSIKVLNPAHVIDPDSLMVACFGYTRSIAYCYSTCVTVYLSLERSLCVLLPFRFKTMFTRTVTITVLVVLAVCVIAPFVPVFATQGLSWRFDPRYNMTRLLMWRKPDVRTIHLVFVITTSLMVPIASQVMIGVTTALMISGLLAASRFKEKASNSTGEPKSDQMSGKEMKVVKMVLALSIVFFTCNLPYVMGAVAQIAEPQFKMHGLYGQLYEVYFGFIFWISAINASVNIFVYYRNSSKFKEIFLKTFWKATDRTEKSGT